MNRPNDRYSRDREQNAPRLNPQLTHMLSATADIVCVSGVRVGGSRESLEIGGVDNPVIRHPITKFPYLPGSSLKGKMRSLLETLDHKGHNGEPCGCAQLTCRVCRYFGPHKKPQHTLFPSRFLFRDAVLHLDSQKELQEAYEQYGLFYVETKTENMIRRNTLVAEHPRLLERVPAGTRFVFQLDIRCYQGDDETMTRKTVETMLKLATHDALGGGGTRGNGRIRFENLAFETVRFER